MHNKSFIADNSAAIIGGRNIGDDLLRRRQRNQLPRPDVVAIGPVGTAGFARLR